VSHSSIPTSHPTSKRQPRTVRRDPKAWKRPSSLHHFRSCWVARNFVGTDSAANPRETSVPQSVDPMVVARPVGLATRENFPRHSTGRCPTDVGRVRFHCVDVSIPAAVREILRICHGHSYCFVSGTWEEELPKKTKWELERGESGHMCKEHGDGSAASKGSAVGRGSATWDEDNSDSDGSAEVEAVGWRGVFVRAVAGVGRSGHDTPLAFCSNRSVHGGLHLGGRILGNGLVHRTLGYRSDSDEVGSLARSRCSDNLVFAVTHSIDHSRSTEKRVNAGADTAVQVAFQKEEHSPTREMIRGKNFAVAWDNRIVSAEEG
jgi:hypothetical protein